MCNVEVLNIIEYIRSSITVGLSNRHVKALLLYLVFKRCPVESLTSLFVPRLEMWRGDVSRHECRIQDIKTGFADVL